MLGDEKPGQPLRRPERGQRGAGTAGHQVQQPAGVAEPHPGRRFDLGPESALGLLKRPLTLLEPALGDQREAQPRVGDADDRLLGPAVLVGQPRVARYPARWSITARASSSIPQMNVDLRRRSTGSPSA